MENKNNEHVIPRSKALALLGLMAGGGALTVATIYLNRKFKINLGNLVEKTEEEKSHDKLYTPDVVIPTELQAEIAKIDKNLKSIEGKIRESEGGEVPTIDSNSIMVLFSAQNLNSVPIVRQGFFQNPDDFSVWITGEGEYGYDFGNNKPAVTGGSDNKRAQAKAIFDEYLTNDQFRVVEIKLTDRDNASNNVVEWEAGSKRYMDGTLHYPWTIYSALIHELTHVGNPLNFTKLGVDKNVLLPYGLKRTADFVKMWTEAMDKEYDFFKTRFFKAKGDATLQLIRGGKVGFGSALSEMIAMLSADYVFPPFDDLMEILKGYNEPLEKFPLTHKAIRRTIAMVHYGIKGSDSYPEGIEPRTVYFEKEYMGKLLWQIYHYAIDDVQNPTP